jgi:AcrR family transcriptional regulator
MARIKRSRTQRAGASAPSAAPELSAGEVTRQRILDAAELLFAEHGYANVSVRAATTKARQNLAAVNYHFGSKDGLLEAVYVRRGSLLNHERQLLLEEMERDPGDSAVELEHVFRAMLLPAIRWSADHKSGRSTFIRFLFRCYHDSTPGLKKLRLKEAETLRQMILPRLRRALPGVSDSILYWGIQFSLGAMHYTIGDIKWTEEVSGGTTDVSSIESITEHLVAFAAGGLRRLVETQTEAGNAERPARRGGRRNQAAHALAT